MNKRYKKHPQGNLAEQIAYQELEQQGIELAPSQPGQLGTHKHIFQIDSHNMGTCECGEVRQFPWGEGSPVIVLKKGNPGIKQVLEKEDNMAISNMAKHNYYEKHKEEILADLRSIGRPATRKKWKIPSGTMGQLEGNWITPQEREDLTRRSFAAIESPKHSGGRAVATPTNNLPSFPEFSNNWGDAVQIKWFEIYEQLIRPTA